MFGFFGFWHGQTKSSITYRFTRYGHLRFSEICLCRKGERLTAHFREEEIFVHVEDGKIGKGHLLWRQRAQRNCLCNLSPFVPTSLKLCNFTCCVRLVITFHFDLWSLSKLVTCTTWRCSADLGVAPQVAVQGRGAAAVDADDHEVQRQLGPGTELPSDGAQLLAKNAESGFVWWVMFAKAFCSPQWWRGPNIWPSDISCRTVSHQMQRHGVTWQPDLRRFQALQKAPRHSRFHLRLGAHSWGAQGAAAKAWRKDARSMRRAMLWLAMQ